MGCWQRCCRLKLQSKIALCVVAVLLLLYSDVVSNPSGRAPFPARLPPAPDHLGEWVPVPGAEKLRVFQPSSDLSTTPETCQLHIRAGHFVPADLSDLFGLDEIDGLEKRLFGLPFAPMTVAYKEAFKLCMIGISMDNHVAFVTDHTSAHNDGSEHDCDALPYLQELAVGKNNTGVAVDVGASDGVSAWLLLAHGHFVHLFETGIVMGYGRLLAMTNIRLNGWESRVALHDTVQTQPASERLDSVLSNEEHIGVLKIDVDGKELLVIDAAQGILPRTSIIQIEMVDQEIGRSGKLSIARRLCDEGFQGFAIWESLSDVESINIALRRIDPMFDAEPTCQEVHQRRIALAAARLGWAIYEDMFDNNDWKPSVFGQDASKRFQLVPLDHCGADKVSKASETLLSCTRQFAFIRRESDAWKRLTAPH